MSGSQSQHSYDYKQLTDTLTGHWEKHIKKNTHRSQRQDVYRHTLERLLSRTAWLSVNNQRRRKGEPSLQG